MRDRGNLTSFKLDSSAKAFGRIWMVFPLKFRDVKEVNLTNWRGGKKGFQMRMMTVVMLVSEIRRQENRSTSGGNCVNPALERSRE